MALGVPAIMPAHPAAGSVEDRGEDVDRDHCEDDGGDGDDEESLVAVFAVFRH